jgi:hyperosmotically inducible periplasmic protein
MVRSGSAIAAILVLSGAVVRGTSPSGVFPPDLSHYKPLCVSNVSTFGENLVEGEIHRELLNLPYFGVFDHLDFIVNGFTVVLQGQVFHPRLRDDAAEIVAHISGVGQIVNLITYLPDSPADNRIRIAVFTAIYSHPSMSIYTTVGGGGAIHVVVQSGRVALEGQVGSNADARRAVQLACAVPGVVSVANHLTVSH